MEQRWISPMLLMVSVSNSVLTTLVVAYPAWLSLALSTLCLGISGALCVYAQARVDLAQRGLTLTERAPCYEDAVTCCGCGAIDLSVFYQGKTCGETWCEACYAAR